MQRDVDVDDVVVPSGVPGMDLLPSNIDLSAAEVQLVHEVAREQTLQRVLGPGDRGLRRHPDRLPALARPADRQRADRLRRRDRAAGVRVLRAARRRPAQDHDRQGAERLNPKLEIDGVLGTMFDGRTLHSREVMERLVQAWGDTVFHTVIRRTVKFSDSTVAGEPITSLRLRLGRRRGLPPAGQGGGWSGASTSEPAGRGRPVPADRRRPTTSPRRVRSGPRQPRRVRTAEDAEPAADASRAAGSGTTRR